MDGAELATRNYTQTYGTAMPCMAPPQPGPRRLGCSQEHSGTGALNKYLLDFIGG